MQEPYWNSPKQIYFVLEEIYFAYCDFMKNKTDWKFDYITEIKENLTSMPGVYYKSLTFDLRGKIVRFWNKAKEDWTRDRVLSLVDNQFFVIRSLRDMITAIHEAVSHEDDNCFYVTGDRVDLEVRVIDRQARVMNSYVGDFQEMIYDVYLQDKNGTEYMTSTNSKFVKDCIVGNTLTIRATFEGFIKAENNKNLYSLKRCVAK